MSPSCNLPSEIIPEDYTYAIGAVWPRLHAVWKHNHSSGQNKNLLDLLCINYKWNSSIFSCNDSIWTCRELHKSTAQSKKKNPQAMQF